MTALRIALVVMLLTLAASATLAEGPAETPGATTDQAIDDLLAYGIEVYRRYYCGHCHQSTIAGTGGTFGPSHDGFAEIAREHLASDAYRSGASTIEEYARESIVDPDAYVVPGFALTSHRMPAYVQLTDDELDALVYLLVQH